jgi:hypothetical protein
MQFAAVLVEYLVTGSGALLWIGIALGVNLSTLLVLDPAQVTLLVPVIYVSGMLLDAVASILLRAATRRAQERPLPWQSRTLLQPDLQPRTAWAPFVVLHSPELGREIQVRSSRDRIARGALLNVMLAVFAMLVWPTNTKNLLPFLPPLSLTIPIGAGLALLLALLWWSAEAQTSQYRQTAVALIEHKLARESRGGESPRRAGFPVPYAPRGREP